MFVRRAFAFIALSAALAVGASARPLGDDQAAGASRLDAAVSVRPVGLPSKKGGLRELTYAFGKASAGEELARIAEGVLIDRAYFARRGPEGAADFLLELSLDRARSSHQDFGAWESQTSTYEVSADVGFRWLDAKGSVVAEGLIAGFARTAIESVPRRPDAARAWGLLIDDVAARAFSQAFEAAAFGNEPPPVGGWIGSGGK